MRAAKIAICARSRDVVRRSAMCCSFAHPGLGPDVAFVVCQARSVGDGGMSIGARAVSIGRPYRDKADSACLSGP